MSKRRKPAPKRTPLKVKIKDACVKCGGAVAAGLLLCATCVGAAQAPPRPAEHKQAEVVVQMSPPLYSDYRFEPRRPGQGWAPIGQPDDHDMPEPDGTFYTGAMNGGTATATRPVRVVPGGLPGAGDVTSYSPW